VHVFVDESRRGSTYLLAAALLCPAELAPVRSTMRGLRVRGERKVHFKHEREPIQKKIAAELVSRQLRTRVYTGTGRPEVVRQLALHELVLDVLSLGTRRLVLDSRGRVGDQADRRVIHSALRAAKAEPDTLSYEHVRSHEEPALWISDAVAWCFGAGGEWRRRIEPIIEKVIDLGSPAGARGRNRP
jgi:hypothetical protein